MRPMLALLCAGLPLAAFAQADTSFTYQGELRMDGAPAIGEFDLEACVYAVATQGSPLACAEPIENLPIADGRFTVALDAGPVFDGTARYLELRVRGGAETAPHLALQPRQLLRATPQAQYAARVPFTGVAGLPPSLSDGDDVGVTQIVAGAGLSGGTITSSGTLAIAPGGVTATMLAPNAVGSTQIDPTQVQTRIAGQCREGEYFRGIGVDGTPQCALLPLPFDRILDSALDVGRHVRLALRDDGRPVLAYHENSLGSVRLYSCADAVCSSGSMRSIATAGDAGEGIALALRADGRPLIAYIDDSSDTLHIYSCSNVECTAGTASPLESPVFSGMVDMALRADGRAVVVYRSGAGVQTYMRTWQCDNIDCTSGTARSHETYPTKVAITIRADGRPLLAAGGNAGSADSPRFWDCADAACTSGTLRTTTGVQYEQVSGLRLRQDGRPLLLTVGLGGSPGIVACSDVHCTSAPGTSIQSCERTSAVDLAMRADGTAVIACTSNLDGAHALGLHDCNTATCSNGSTRPLLPYGRTGSAVAIAVRADDRPVIAYYDQANGDLGLYICGSPTCP
ncbi:MAG TPA: hypothetical protein VN581_11315 [Patescibacteria group bacterium]|nr:hypothetical protein [Patescibacteria group bacterium]